MKPHIRRYPINRRYTAWVVLAHRGQITRARDFGIGMTIQEAWADFEGKQR